MNADELNLKVYRLFREKGKELKGAGLFSEEVWLEYINSLGCETYDKQSCTRCGKTSIVPHDSKMIFFRDEHFMKEKDGSKYYDRMILVDTETAFKIAVLGLP